MPKQYGLVTGGGLNLRAQPDISSARLTQIFNNTTLIVVAHNDDWYSTACGTLTGYVMKRQPSHRIDFRGPRLTAFASSAYNTS